MKKAVRKNFGIPLLGQLKNRKLSQPKFSAVQVSDIASYHIISPNLQSNSVLFILILNMSDITTKVTIGAISY